jgi:uncharacterized protein YjhX (UPF0386 family)
MFSRKMHHRQLHQAEQAGRIRRIRYSNGTVLTVNTTGVPGQWTVLNSTQVGADSLVDVTGAALLRTRLVESTMCG